LAGIANRYHWKPSTLKTLNLVKFYIYKPKSTGRASLIKKWTVRLFVSRALKSVFVDLSLPKRRALFDFPRDPQFVKSKLTYLLMRTAKRPWTNWHGWNSTINFGLGATSIRWVEYNAYSFVWEMQIYKCQLNVTFCHIIFVSNTSGYEIAGNFRSHYTSRYLFWRQFTKLSKTQIRVKWGEMWYIFFKF
jgi:hypothetical protein